MRATPMLQASLHTAMILPHQQISDKHYQIHLNLGKAKVL